MENESREKIARIVRQFIPRGNAVLELHDSTLLDEAGIDSPRMTDILLEIEDQFEITIEDERYQKVRTFGEVVTLVTEVKALAA